MVSAIDSKKRKIENFFLVLLIFTSVDTVLFGTNSNVIFRVVPRIIGILSSFAFIFLHSYGHQNNKNTRFVAIFLVLFSIFVVSSTLNGNSVDGSLSRLISILCGFTIALCVDKRQFIAVFVKSVFFICIVAMALEALAYLAPAFLQRLPVITNTSNRQFYTFLIGAFGFENTMQTYKRSMGIFWEPGAFSIYIVIALSFELFFKNKSKTRIIIDIIALIFTFSTTGYIAFFALFITYLAFGLESKNVSLKVFLIICVVSCGIFLFASDGPLSSLVFEKIKSGNSSSASRFSSFFNGLRISIRRPFFGYGINETAGMEVYLASGEASYTNGGVQITNTMIGYMVYYGIPFAAIIAIGTFMFYRSVSSNAIVSLCLFSILMLGYFGERFYSFLPFVIAFYGFKK